MKKVLTAGLIVTAAYSSQGFTLGGGLDLKDGLFWGSDLNRNEQIDINEAKNIYNLSDPKVFAKYDTSGEGVITKFEFYDYLRNRSEDE
ncbi:MAG: hypothetical protein AB8B89_00580 [Gammaproteobacteria bacterium]